MTDVLTQRVNEAGGRSFFASSVREFMRVDTDAIIGRLSQKHVAFHPSAEADQVLAWQREIEILRNTFNGMRPRADEWSIMLEVPLLRLGKRMDAVVLMPGIVAVIEFKIGETTFNSAHCVQTERYALSLCDFHEASQSRLVVPILCAEKGPMRAPDDTIANGLMRLQLCNAKTLFQVFHRVSEYSDESAADLGALAFDMSPYRPTPTIVEAAQALYSGHGIADIGRGDASDAELQEAANVLRSIVKSAEDDRQKVVCFVTGAPGAGKTLLGLDLALKSSDLGNAGALLSGNRPLVHVLTEALAIDRAARTGESKTEAKYKADAAIQNLLGYLKEHTDGAKPPEHVIIFDEAQRAWDEKVGQKLMNRPTSEPALFLNILDRLDWSCLVCLVGPGQEINRGEGGLPLWGEALKKAAESGSIWRVIAAPEAIDGGPAVSGGGLAVSGLPESIEIRRDPRLHLANAIRSYRNPLHGKWVAALLEGKIERARSIATEMESPPAFLSRNLEAAKEWLRDRRRGGRSVGLLTSSGAVRLIGDGVPPAARSNELDPIGHWFLKPYTDFRSSGALETPMSEFGCQGLELDYAGLCWGGDLIWSERGWTPRMMRAPRWQIIREAEKMRFRLNGYRVLLTRARAGMIIFVPPGSVDDATRSPTEADGIANALLAAGCAKVPDGAATT